MWGCQPSHLEPAASAHPALWTECQHSDRLACRLARPSRTRTGVSPTLPAISKLYPSITISGMPIAFLVATSIFLVNRIRGEQASMWQRGQARPRRRRKEHYHETSIHSRLVSHFARPSSLDDIRIHSICTVAGALVGFSYFAPERR
jgi:hypothetical protein